MAIVKTKVDESHERLMAAHPSVYRPAAYDKEVLYAIRALLDGKANEGQQKRAMDWIMFNACHIGYLSITGIPAETDFREGQRSIGLQIARMREPEALAIIEPKPAKRAPRRGKKPEAEA